MPLQLGGEAAEEEGVTICNNNKASDIGKWENKPSASLRTSEQVLWWSVLISKHVAGVLKPCLLCFCLIVGVFNVARQGETHLMLLGGLLDQKPWLNVGNARVFVCCCEHLLLMDAVKGSSERELQRAVNHLILSSPLCLPLLFVSELPWRVFRLLSSNYLIWRRGGCQWLDW